MSKQQRVSANMPSTKQRSAHLHSVQWNNTTIVPEPSRGHSLLQLQKIYGNRYVQNMMALTQQNGGETAIQTKRQRRRRKSDKMIVFPPKTITVDMGRLKDKTITMVRIVVANARINAVNYASSVSAACKAFERYAEPKLKDLAGEITAGDLLSSLVSVVIGTAGNRIATTLGTKLGEAIAEAISDEIKDDVKKATEKYAKSKKNNEDELKGVVTSLVQGSEDAVTAIGDKIDKKLKKLADSTIDNIKSNKALAQQQADFVNEFADANISETDTLLESKFGIPSPSRSKQAHLTTFSQLVEQFERKYIWIRATMRERIEMNIAGMQGTGRTLESRAKERAEEATKERKRQIKYSTSKNQ